MIARLIEKARERAQEEESGAGERECGWSKSEKQRQTHTGEEEKT